MRLSILVADHGSHIWVWRSSVVVGDSINSTTQLGSIDSDVSWCTYILGAQNLNQYRENGTTRKTQRQVRALWSMGFCIKVNISKK